MNCFFLQRWPQDKTHFICMIVQVIEAVENMREVLIETNIP